MCGIWVGVTALEDDGTEFLQSTNHIVHCHILEDEDTKFLQNTNQMAQFLNPKVANPLNSMC